MAIGPWYDGNVGNVMAVKMNCSNCHASLETGSDDAVRGNLFYFRHRGQLLSLELLLGKGYEP
jgi:hypothetical protein